MQVQETSVATKLLPAPEDRSRSHTRLAIELVRIGIGLVWVVNLVFIVNPQNQFFGTFAKTAESFAPTTVGGPALANFVASYPTVFAWTIALVTAYLAVAFLLGVTTRIACIVGGVFSAVLLGAQIGSTYVFPGGTDVGPHPLYILIYIGLALGGAGSAYSVQHWAEQTLVRRRALAKARKAGAPSGTWASSLSLRTYFAFFAAGTLVAFGLTFGLFVALPPHPASTSTPVSVSYENLTININPVNGWPQYSPANFTVPAGQVVFTITDHDLPMSWAPCPCVVSGTTNNLETVNGTPEHLITTTNVAHSFTISRLGLDVYTPGQSVVQFTVDLVNNGTFVWFCIVPCGTGSNPYTTPPMGTPGYMTGTMTVG